MLLGMRGEGFLKALGWLGAMLIAVVALGFVRVTSALPADTQGVESRALQSPGDCPNPVLAASRPRPNLVVVTHGWIGMTAGDPHGHIDLADAIRADLDRRGHGGEWDVVAYSWFTDARTTFPWQAAADAEHVGDCLGDKLASRDYRQVHLIGHSAGAWLVDSLSAALAPRSEYMEVTFLDAYTPFAKEGVSTLGQHADFAEHIVDTTAIDLPAYETRSTDQVLSQAFNVDITPLGGDHGGHRWPLSWYLETVRDGSKWSWGYSRSPESGARATHDAYARGGCLELRTGGTSSDCGDEPTKSGFKNPIDFDKAGRFITGTTRDATGAISRALGRLIP